MESVFVAPLHGKLYILVLPQSFHCSKAFRRERIVDTYVFRISQNFLIFLSLCS